VLTLALVAATSDTPATETTTKPGSRRWARRARGLRGADVPPVGARVVRWPAVCGRAAARRRQV